MPPKRKTLRREKKGGGGQKRGASRSPPAPNSKKPQVTPQNVTEEQSDNKEQEVSTSSADSKAPVFTQEDVESIVYELKSTKKELKVLKKMQGAQPEETVSATKLKVQRYVKHTLFKSVKFVSDMQALDKIGKKVVKYFDIEKNRRENFWIAYKQIALQALTQQRNVAVQALKEKWFGA